jgi:DNA-binding response OmpR family regulator
MASPVRAACVSRIQNTGLRVLLIEDEPKISVYVKRGLEEQGYAEDTVFTGREALTWVSAAPIDLIVLDILLPELNGLEVCKEMRQRGINSRC